MDDYQLDNILSTKYPNIKNEKRKYEHRMIEHLGVRDNPDGTATVPNPNAALHPINTMQISDEVKHNIMSYIPEYENYFAPERLNLEFEVLKFHHGEKRATQFIEQKYKLPDMRIVGKDVSLGQLHNYQHFPYSHPGDRGYEYLMRNQIKMRKREGSGKYYKGKPHLGLMNSVLGENKSHFVEER